ncbi:MAG: MBL fold metallo-hydrolase [Candidatus Micrarchaeota archaeon]|nr:MBL fold metallo-hydrolase [Candidatus Micrarchaeota archaeon]
MGYEQMLHWIGHASFYIKGGGATVFIDPFRVSDHIREKADIVLVTHAHFDHYSKEDIKRVMGDGCEIISSPTCPADKEFDGVRVMKPGSKYSSHGVSIEAVPAYNVKGERLKYHPRSNGWVGYVVEVDGTRTYHAGDTDFVEEMKSIRDIDIALLPSGGTYTMDYREAVEAGKAIGARHTAPIHYKNLLGEAGAKEAESYFTKNLKGAAILKEVQQPTYHF